ncbi:MAG: hypothetical protein SGJ02_05350 [bacterium]|nr:hypothetical protein [bacterium]
MPRQNRDGKFILSASEIGSFTVCPESWRLRTVQHKESKHSDRVEIGQEMHAAWSAKYDEHLFLIRAARIVLALLVLVLATFILIGEYSIIK